MVAAAAYALLRSTVAAAGSANQTTQHQVLVLGTNHFTTGPPACLSSAAAWRTPLGDVTVDAALNQALAAAGLPFNDTPHKWASCAASRPCCSAPGCMQQARRGIPARSLSLLPPPCRRSLEHSAENQLPFLQHVLGAAAFAFAPVCVGWLGSAAAVDQLAQQLLAALRQAQPAPLLIATSDFTHAVSAGGAALPAVVAGKCSSCAQVPAPLPPPGARLQRAVRSALDE